ncbi:hypothetical protein BUY00_11260 [Staphylococcus chromogenes]|uniref:hypothetical protein n=2 Tax=Staphylococcus chromogenes TaxID=46126 RepID=UPI000D1A890D|nr:hypothetical protein [Staphylococcus chromogenes]MCE4966630.1 hypothetical protein [Staphylococcus chromogenes]MDT0701252.1 hypothetical protein [Staphylococcus chromogenes]PTF68444.1 hypothetical protein BUY01_08535 [Staphylococcus chromogenes]PTF69204.1 hypothetical protein BUY03_07965 [Staphylococcus chromogenes]PTF74859.1 hypothetical protein BUX97_07980 [Staphylococcus chromogenes]
MLEDKNDIRLLYQSIQELASEMGQNQLNTKTVSLIFLEMDLKYSVFEEVEAKFLKYIAHKNSDEIMYSDLVEIINSALPRDRELSSVIINRIIIGFANNYYPILKVTASNIISEEGYTIYKQFNPKNLDN